MNGGGLIYWGVSTDIAEIDQGSMLYHFDQDTHRNQVDCFKNWMIYNNVWNGWN